MPRFTDVYAPIIGRILMGGFFLWEGIEKALNFDATAQLIASTGLPEPLSLAAVVIIIEVLGGIALVVGFKSSSTALVLAIFTIATSLLSVSFNSETGISLFLQSMAIVGGLFYISAFGSGSWSPDWKYKR